MQLLSDLSSKLVAASSIQEIVETVLDSLPRLLGTDSVAVWAVTSGDHFTLLGKTEALEHSDQLRSSPNSEKHHWLSSVIQSRGIITNAQDAGQITSTSDSPFALSLGIPLAMHGDSFGVVEAKLSNQNSLNKDLKSVLVIAVNQMSIAWANISTNTGKLTAFSETSTHITSLLGRDEVIQLALEEMERLTRHRGMTIWRRDGSYMVLEGMTGLSVDNAHDLGLRFLFSDYSQIYQVVDSQWVFVEDGVSTLPDGLTCHENASSWMGVPLVNQGHVVGLMMLTDSESSTYLSKSDQNIAFAFASQVAIALANADLFEQAFDRANELGTLLEAAQATSLTTDLDTVLRTVVELMFSALEMDICSIMLWDEVDNRLEVQLDVTPHGELDTTIGKGTVLQLDNFPAKLRALRDRDVIVISTEDPNRAFPEEIEEIKALDVVARMLVPLVVSDTSRGLIQLGTRSREGITQQKVRLARALGSQVAVAIENARLSAETVARLEESLIINDLSRAISSTLDVDNMFRVVRDQLPNVTGASELYMALYEPETEEITFPYAVSNGQEVSMEPRKLASDEVSFIIKQRRPLNLGADYYSPEELRRSLGIVDGDDDAKSYLGVPMIAGDEVLGVLAVRDTERTRAFTINEQRILTTVGSHLGAAIQNARLFRQISSFADDLEKEVTERTRELEDERDRIDTLYQITLELARTLDMDRLMPRALGMVAKAVTADDSVIMQLDPITDQLYILGALNQNSLQHIPDSEHPFHPAENIAKHIILEDEHVLMINELHDEDYWDPGNSPMQPWHSALAVLLETNEELLGVMVVMSKRPSAFHESHLRLMVAAAAQVASSINNAELYQLIRQQAERLGAQLRAEQEEAVKNKAILEGIADGVVLADTDGRVILFNAAAERILQVPRTDVVGRPFSEVTAMYDGAAVQLSQALENYVVNQEENAVGGPVLDDRVVLGDRTVSVQLSPVYTGEKLLGTVLLFRDITEAAASEMLLKEQLTHAERASSILEVMEDGVLYIDVNGDIGLYNSRAESFLDFAREEALGKNLRYLLDLHGEEIVGWARPIIQWIEFKSLQDTQTVQKHEVRIGETPIMLTTGPVYLGSQDVGSVTVIRPVS